MTIKWHVDRWAKEPKRVEVIKEAACFITIKNDHFFNTWDEAHQELMIRAMVDVQNAEADWQRAKANLQRISQLKKPKESEGEGCDGETAQTREEKVTT